MKMATPLLLVAVMAGEGRPPALAASPAPGLAISWAEIKTRGH